MIKLHLGCGGNYLGGYINIDAIPTLATDKIADITDLSKEYENNSIEEILNEHVIEHLSKEGGKKALKHWYNLLKTGGKLIIECPDFLQTMKQFFDVPLKFQGIGVYADGNRLHNIYGAQDNKYQFHKWGYWPDSMKKILNNIGFKEIKFVSPATYHAQEEPCMRVKAIK